MSTKKKLLLGSAGAAAGGAGLDVDEVFSTFLYDGTGSALTINNGIDLSGEGGLTWIKGRMAGGFSHYLFDTERGVTKYIRSNETNAEGTDSNTLTAFNSNGFTVGSANATNYNTGDFVSWTFRNSPMFFDVVTWTGSNFGGGRQISHNLGSVPGIIIIKRTSAASAWYVWHRSRPNAYTVLNESDAEDTSNTKYYFGDGTNVVAPTSTEFTTQTMNENGFTYVAYLFAHNNNDGGFGLSNDQDIIKCGSYTGNGSTQSISLGYEPQFILLKNASSSSNWVMLDSMRGVVTSSSAADDKYLFPNSDTSEGGGIPMNFTATGFDLANEDTSNKSGDTFIYMAIRRGSLFPPTDATKVFAIDDSSTTDIGGYTLNSNFPVDLYFFKNKGGGDSISIPRLTVGDLRFNSTGAEDNRSSVMNFDSNTGVTRTSFQGGIDSVDYAFRRAPGFFDVQAFTLGNSSNREVKHNLQAIPEMIWWKERSGTSYWMVWHKSFTSSQYMSLHLSSAILTSADIWGTSSHTSTGWYMKETAFGSSGDTCISYTFASVPNVSFVGSYTGNGSGGGATQTIDCGFSNGSRFILIKRTSASGAWFVFDTVRGIVSGTEPHLTLNSTAAEVSGNDSIDPHSSGFTVVQNGTTEINSIGQTYIFYAIA